MHFMLLLLLRNVLGEHGKIKEHIDHALLLLKFDSVPIASLSSIKKGIVIALPPPPTLCFISQSGFLT